MSEQEEPVVMKPRAKAQAKKRQRGRPKKVDTLLATEEDLASVFPEYKPGIPVAGVKYGQPVYEDELHYFTEAQIRYLETYIETLDKTKAAKAAGIRQRDVWRSKHFEKAITDINYLTRLKWREKVSQQDHIRLLHKFEGMLDEMWSKEKYKEATTMAGNLLKGSETLMKATGQFAHEDISSGNMVSVNINIGGSAEVTADQETQTIDIDTGG